MTELTPAEAAASTRPALLLDIDGVLRLDKNDSDAVPEGYVTHPQIHWYAYNPVHGIWLNEVASAVDIHYISDHQEDSHAQIGEALDLPEFSWVDAYRDLTGARTYPHARALAITALFGERPVVWVDDDVSAREFEWAAERNQTAPTLLVKTDSQQGLEAHQMKIINSWLEPLALGKTAEGPTSESVTVKR